MCRARSSRAWGELISFRRGHKVVGFARWATDHVTQRIQIDEIVALAPQFIGNFWGKEREVHIGYLGPIKKVVMNEEYFIESVTDPMAKVLKGALAPMILAPGLVNNDEILALMAYVKSHSK